MKTFKLSELEAWNMKTFEEIKHLLPTNYVHEGGRIILIDDKGKPILSDNGNGTVSGFQPSTLCV